MAKIKNTMTVSLEEFGKKAGEYALDEFEYKGLTIRQWADKITSGEYQPVKHGRWILSDDKCWLTCSFCGTDIDVSCGAPFFYVDNDEVSHINFCPNCGYKQDLEGDDING